MWLKRTLSVDSRVLLGYYAIIPVLMVVALCDHLFWHSAIRDGLPQRPEVWLWWVLVFNLPHIMASLVTYAEGDYIRAYKAPLTRGLLVSCALTLLIPVIFGGVWLFVFAACYTMYHVLMQQYGVSLMLLRMPANAVFQLWRWLSIVGSSLIYLNVYFPPIRNYLPAGWTLDGAGIVLVLASMPFGVWLWWKAVHKSDASPVAKWYFAGTFFMIAASTLFYCSGYLIFMFLIPRFVHDASAFTVYAVHDHNRNLNAPHNVIYRLLKPLHIPPAILCLPLGIAIACIFSLGSLAGNMVLGALVSICSFLHYYLEGYMWKRGTPHRLNTPFSI